ncbi:MAG TPA: DUF1206 domain-containing protein [Streptosporangiaceae bacterium]
MLSGTAGRKLVRARGYGRHASRSGLLKALGRAGLAARGVMYMLIGWIAIQIAFGQHGRLADNSGALRTVAATPAGHAALWFLAIGFVGLAVWRLAQAAYGAPGPDGRKPATRLLCLGRAAIYGFVAYSALRFALGVGAPTSGNRQSVDLTTTIMRQPGGQAAVIVAGIALAGGGLYLAYSTWRREFLKELQFGQVRPEVRRLVERLGLVGGIARGVVFAAAGVFLFVAGAHARPSQAKGIDGTLRAFAATSFGPWLLVVIAAGLVTFGVYSLCEARWRRV